MSKQTTDVLVAGGGIAGQIAALALAQVGLDVICVDPNTEPKTGSNADLRSTAFLAPSVDVLQTIGVFDDLTDHAAELRFMRLCDAGGQENIVRETVDFDASEIGAERFGWNIPNAPLRAALAQRLGNTANAQMINGASVERLTARRHDTIARLSNGQHISAKLVIAADGRDSKLRRDAGINAPRINYGQKALVFHVTHDSPHDGVSIEVHRTGGPFTLVPLHDARRSAVVWMETNKQADQLMDLDDLAFEAAANARACNVLGPLKLASKRGAFPIISQGATKLIADRLVLIAEAAHVVPPIGAQGLNMSLADIATLCTLVDGQPDPGAPALLTQFERKRLPDMALHVAGIDALNRASAMSIQSLRDLRAQGLRLLGGTKPLKTLAMRKGLG